MPSRSILLTEDDDTQREIITDILRASGYSVTPVNGGEAALAALSEGTFDLLLTDLRMGGWTVSSCFVRPSASAPSLRSSS